MEKSVVKVNKYAKVKQSNNLTIARYTLSLTEQRLMYAICSHIEKNADSFSKVRFTVSELAELCNITGKRKYEDIRSASNKLLQRLVNIPTADGGEYTTHWLQSRRYYPNDCTIEFRLDEDLRGELLQLRKAYIDTPVLVLTGFKKKYSSRMYLLLKKMVKIGEFEYTLDFFREIFQLAETYKKFSNIKNGVLEPTFSELNSVSDIHIEHEYIKEGRFFTKIHFKISSKKSNAKLCAVEVKKITRKNSSNENKWDDRQQEAYDRLIKRGVSVKKAAYLIKHYSVEVIEKNIKYALRQKNTSKNLPGLIISFIDNDIAGENEVVKREAEQREKQRWEDKIKFYDGQEQTKVEVANKGIIAADDDKLSEIEVDLIKAKGAKIGKYLQEKIKRLGLTLDDVLAGKTKKSNI